MTRVADVDDAAYLPITDAERDLVERRLVERYVSSADKDPLALAGILRSLWGELRGRRARDAALVREEVRRRMRWELDVRAREDAHDRAVLRALRGGKTLALVTLAVARPR
jgi:hypothetical protein